MHYNFFSTFSSFLSSYNNNNNVGSLIWFFPFSSFFPFRNKEYYHIAYLHNVPFTILIYFIHIFLLQFHFLPLPSVPPPLLVPPVGKHIPLFIYASYFSLQRWNWEKFLVFSLLHDFCSLCSCVILIYIKK